jgi:hypothetical protein
MTLVLKDRVKEQTTTTGTGTVTLGGAVSGFESFSAVGNGNTTYYAIVHQTADEWEVGLGTYTAAGTLLSRDTILESTNSDAAVNFSAGTKDVFVTYPSDKAIYADGSGNVGIGTSSPASELTVSDGTASGLTPFGGTELFLDSSGDNYLQFGSGTSSSPAIYFGDSADGDVGGIIYAHASNAMSFRTNGSERLRITDTMVEHSKVWSVLRITDTGLVGIGTTAPGGNLHVQGAAGNQVRLYLTDGDATGTANSLLISKSGTTSFISDRQASSQLWFGTADTERMRIDSSGNLLVGTTSATTDLAYSPKLKLSGNGPGLYFEETDTSQDYSITALGGKFYIRDATAVVPRLTIDSSGNVGIGTLAPSQKLTVEGTDARIYLTGANTDINMTGTADGQLSLDGNGFGFGIALNSSGANLYTNSASRALILGTDETERMRITGTGNVGIGTSSPGTPLHVEGAAAANNLAIRVINTDTSGYSTIQLGGTDAGIYRNGSAQTGYGGASSLNLITVGAHPIAFSTGNTPRVIIDSSGNVGIGNAAPSYLLDLYKAASTVVRVRNSAATGGTPSTTHGEFVIESTDGNMGMQFLGSTTADQRILFSDTAAASGQIVYNHTSNYMALFTNTAERMRIDSAGNVGIGTSSPANPLHVVGEGTFTRGLELGINGVDATSYITQYRSTVETIIGPLTTRMLFGTVSNHDIAIQTNNAERMRITSAGNVGIGTTSAPSAKLNIQNPLAAGASTN